jgi:hypothetical protein
VQITLDRGDAGTVTSFEAEVSALPQIRQAKRLFGDPDYLLVMIIPAGACSTNGIFDPDSEAHSRISDQLVPIFALNESILRRLPRGSVHPRLRIEPGQSRPSDQDQARRRHTGNPSTPLQLATVPFPWRYHWDRGIRGVLQRPVAKPLLEVDPQHDRPLRAQVIRLFETRVAAHPDSCAMR